MTARRAKATPATAESKVQAAVTAAVPEGTTPEGVEPAKDETPETDQGAVQEAVTAAAAPEADQSPEQGGDTTDPAEVTAAVTAATPDTPAEEPEAPAAPAPTRAGTVEVKATQGVFAWIDKDGSYQTIQRGETAKVTAAQADRAEALGVAERV